MRLAFPRTSRIVHDKDGLPFRLVQDQPWDADDPIVQQYPECFSGEPTNVGHSRLTPVVEQATAEPGEVRPLRRAARYGG